MFTFPEMVKYSYSDVSCWDELRAPEPLKSTGANYVATDKGDILEKVEKRSKGTMSSF